MAAGASVIVSCLDQPRTKCQTGRGAFAAKYTPVSNETAPCVLKGESVGIQPYNPANADKTAPDVEHGLVAIRGAQTANALTTHPAGDPVADNKPYALGNFLTAEPGGDDFCDVPTLNPSIQNLAEVPGVDAGEDGGGGKPPIPAVSIKYEWKNLRFYVTAAQAGVQMIGDLTYTKDDCTVDYKVNAIYPSTPCSTKDPDSGVVSLAPEKCLPPDLEHGRTGSAINVDVPTECDPDLMLCVLKKNPP